MLQVECDWLVQLEACPSQAANNVDFISDIRGFTHKVKVRLRRSQFFANALNQPNQDMRAVGDDDCWSAGLRNRLLGSVLSQLPEFRKPLLPVVQLADLVVLGEQHTQTALVE